MRKVCVIVVIILMEGHLMHEIVSIGRKETMQKGDAIVVIWNFIKKGSRTTCLAGGEESITGKLRKLNLVKF